jgi:hypothetical protein
VMTGTPWARTAAKVPGVTDRPPSGGCQLPALLVLAVVATGLLLSRAVDWQVGARVLGLGFLLAAVLRTTLPAARAGWLAVRTRSLDVAVLLSLGAAVLVLAETIPDV